MQIDWGESGVWEGSDENKPWIEAGRSHLWKRRIQKQVKHSGKGIWWNEENQRKLKCRQRELELDCWFKLGKDKHERDWNRRTQINSGVTAKGIGEIKAWLHLGWRLVSGREVEKRMVVIREGKTGWIIRWD